MSIYFIFQMFYYNLIGYAGYEDFSVEYFLVVIYKFQEHSRGGKKVASCAHSADFYI